MQAVTGSLSPHASREGREPLPDHAGESPLLSRSGREKGLRGSGAGTLGVVGWDEFSLKRSGQS